MILEYLKYFSRFPARDGVLDMFINGSSDLYEYEELKGVYSRSFQTFSTRYLQFCFRTAF